MARGSTHSLMHRAVQMRKEPTPAEAKLWAYLRRNKLRGVSFRRQHAIGRYVADFCSPSAKLVIEVDGSEHLRQEEDDAVRTKYLESKGYRVLRFWNTQVLNEIDGVIQAIREALRKG